MEWNSGKVKKKQNNCFAEVMRKKNKVLKQAKLRQNLGEPKARANGNGI